MIMRKFTDKLLPFHVFNFRNIFDDKFKIFSQTTSVTRVGGPGGLLKVRVEIDKLGDLKLKISDLFGGRKIIGKSILFLYTLLFGFLIKFIFIPLNDI